MDKDKAATLIGAAGAVITAINPVIGGISTGVLHGGDWLQLATAGIFALLGYFTNKK